MKTFFRLLTLVALVLIGLFAWGQYKSRTQLQALATLPPLPAPVPASVEIREPDPVILPPEAPETGDVPVPEPVSIAPEAPEPVECQFPGDGYVTYPHGFNYLDEYVEFTYPEQVDGYQDDTLPIPDPDLADVCVTVLFDISATGRVINISFLDVQPEAVADDEYYTKMVTDRLRTRRYQPGQRNGKPIRVNNFFETVRFRQS